MDILTANIDSTALFTLVAAHKLLVFGTDFLRVFDCHRSEGAALVDPFWVRLYCERSRHGSEDESSVGEHIVRRAWELF